MPWQWADGQGVPAGPVSARVARIEGLTRRVQWPCLSFWVRCGGDPSGRLIRGVAEVPRAEDDKAMRWLRAICGPEFSLRRFNSLGPEALIAATVGRPVRVLLKVVRLKAAGGERDQAWAVHDILPESGGAGLMGAPVSLA
jgi:hypothetical protein